MSTALLAATPSVDSRSSGRAVRVLLLALIIVLLAAGAFAAGRITKATVRTPAVIVQASVPKGPAHSVVTCGGHQRFC